MKKYNDILIIDDDISEAQKIQQILSCNCKISIATELLAANAIIDKKTVDAILINADVKNFDPYIFCDTMQNTKETSSIPIVFFGFEGSQEAKALESGALDFIKKPLDSYVLKMKLEHFAKLKKQQDKLESTNERLRLWEQSSTDYIFITTDSENLILSWNIGAEKLTGYTSKEAIGKNFEDFLKDDKRAKPRGNGDKLEDNEQLIGRKDGSIFIANVSKNILYNKYSDFCGYSILAKDVTEQKKAQARLEITNELLKTAVEDEIKKLEAKDEILRNQSKFAVMGEMVSVIAHQWRQPLAHIASITAALQLRAMLHDIEINDEVMTKLEEIESVAMQLSNIIDDFRNFSKPIGTIEEINVQSVINTTLNLLQGAINTNNTEILIDDSCNTNIIACKRDLIQVFLNILKNSIDALHEANINFPKITVSTTVNTENIVVKIADNGCGIPIELLPNKLFEPYVSTKGNVGTGLGLYIVKNILEKRYAKIRAYNCDENSGAVFEIILPLKINDDF